jgi:uroporphyrinogen decarboxylase
MVKGGNELIDATKRLRDEMAGGPHIFNLGHGITPDACPKHVELMLRVLRD